MDKEQIRQIANSIAKQTDNILKSDFGFDDGLESVASTVAWAMYGQGEMYARFYVRFQFMRDDPLTGYWTMKELLDDFVSTFSSSKIYIQSHYDELLVQMQNAIASYPDSELEGYVYLMRESVDGYYKIGVSNNPQNRLRDLNTLPQNFITLIHTIPSNQPYVLEADFHNLYKSQRIGGEWFELSEKDVDFIKSHKRMFYRE